MQKTKMIFKKDPEIVAGLGVLGFDELNVYPRMKDVVKMFRKMALRKHPDKPGGSTEDFQILQEAFIRIGSFLQAQQDKSDSITADDEDYEEDIAQQLFKEYYINGTKFESTFLHLFDNSEDLLKIKIEREKTAAVEKEDLVKKPFSRR